VRSQDEAVDIRTNAAFLLAAFMSVELHYTPEAAWAPFTQLAEDSFATYRDATFCAQDYHLTILACLRGLCKAIECGFYDPETFDLEEYILLDNPTNADMHMVCPKFIAFKGPKGNRGDGREKEMYTFTPEHYSSVFEYMGVSAIVRLNEADTYDRAGFTDFGFSHHDLYFDDCTVPSNATIAKFLDTCEREPGVVAVHCKAGLGRTGTLIAIYLMKHFGFTASECIGWLRIVRPGSVIAPQQQYLHHAEAQYCRRVDKSKPGRRLSQPIQELEAAAEHVPVWTSAESEAMGVLVADAQMARAARLATPSTRTRC
jgi:cell division cycle 14